MVGYMCINCNGLGYTSYGDTSMLCDLCIGRGWTNGTVYDGYGSVRAGIPIEGDTEDDITIRAHEQDVEVYISSNIISE
jgi:hypothetical protein